jgi:hypothetical protein
LKQLSRFDTTVARDKELIIPFIQHALNAIDAGNGSPLLLLASPWSPPGWMKTPLSTDSKPVSTDTPTKQPTLTPTTVSTPVSTLIPTSTPSLKQGASSAAPSEKSTQVPPSGAPTDSNTEESNSPSSTPSDMPSELPIISSQPTGTPSLLQELLTDDDENSNTTTVMVPPISDMLASKSSGSSPHMLGSNPNNGLKNDPRILAAWAKYFSLFIDAYSANGIPIWAVTPQNEPEFAAPWEACVYNSSYERMFVDNYLGPLLDINHPNVSLMILSYHVLYLYMSCCLFIR